MSNIIDFIAGESLTIEGIIKDDENGTPFEDGYTCYAEAFDKFKRKVMDKVDGTRDLESEPFVISILPEHTSQWADNIVVVVSVVSPDETIVGKEKLYLKVEKFG